jgi:hypothetical protein
LEIVMGMAEDLLERLRKSLYSNPYVQPGAAPPPQPQSPAGPTLGGLAGGAQRDLKMREPYMMYVMAMQEQGQKPMPYEQWLAAVMRQQGQQDQQMPPPGPAPQPPAPGQQ